MSIAANKVKGVYAALLSDVYSAQRARLSNDANVACMGRIYIRKQEQGDDDGSVSSNESCQDAHPAEG